MDNLGLMETVDDWLKKRQQSEGAEGLWRIGDQLYDLQDFAKRHPGGAQWIQMTKGVDVTTAFYSYHVTSAAEELLPSLRVRPARTPSAEPHAFREDGFYMELRRRVRSVLREKAPLVRTLRAQSCVIADALVILTLATSGVAARTHSYAWAVLSGFLLALTAGVAHNFFHQKINFRRLYFDLSIMASREWMISHALSHHLYPNTSKDLEVTIFRPIFEFLPLRKKTFAQRYLSWFFAPLIYASAAHTQLAKRLHKLQMEDAVCLAIPATMLLAGGSLFTTWKLWTIVLISCSAYFLAQGLTAGHHHPGIFHEGDTPREDKDWGLQQLDATSNRSDISSLYSKYPILTVALEMSHFGSHRLHHLFPTIDGSVLPILEETLDKTLKEFGATDIECPDGKTVWTLFTGKFRQLARNRVNDKPRGAR